MAASGSSDPISVIVNAGAGSEAGATGLAQAFRDAGLHAAITLSRTPRSLMRTLRAAAARRPPLIVAAGGDGTVSAAAGIVAGTGVALAVLPLGTRNHFARDLGVPLDLAGAVGVIAGGRTSVVDVAEVNGRVFVNNSSLGLYPALVRLREHQRRNGWGRWRAAAWAVLPTLRRYPFVVARLTLDGVPHERRTPFVFVGNNCYRFGGRALAQRAQLDGGVLSLCTAPHAGRIDVLRLAGRALAGRLRAGREFDVRTAREIVVETRRSRLQVAMDGEVVELETPLVYRLRPRALRVIAPAGAG